jgi:hypothetical protein
LFTLDLQINFLASKGSLELGKWLGRKWEDCIATEDEAMKALEHIPFSDDELHAHWNQQVK